MSRLTHFKIVTAHGPRLVYGLIEGSVTGLTTYHDAQGDSESYCNVAPIHLDLSLHLFGVTIAMDVVLVVHLLKGLTSKKPHNTITIGGYILPIM